MRVAALRKRTWFRVLDRVERGIFDLTIRFVDGVRSSVLAGQLVRILVKLRDAARSAFTRHVEEFGASRMWGVIEFALSLGSSVALGWACDGFARWFGLNNFNNPVGWRLES